MVAAVLALLPVSGWAEDWSQWRGRHDRNGVSNEIGLPDRFEETSDKPAGTHLQNVKWVARLGAGAFGSPVVSGGKVFIGGSINYENSAILWCFRESDGRMLWRMRSPFWPNLVNRTWGICSTPTVEGNRVYLLGHHGEVLCLDANGLAGRAPSAEDLELIKTNRQCENPFEIAPDGRRILELTAGTPGVPEPTDAHIIWRFDLLREVNCWPYNAQSAAILIRGDRLYVATGTTFSEDGRNGSKYWIEQWKAKYGKSTYESPSLIVLDKHTGKLLAVDKEGISEKVFHGAQSSPALGLVNGKELLFYGDGNGCCYAFDPDFAPGEGGRPGVLKRVWKFDCLAPGTYDRGYAGSRLKRAEVVATPVFYSNRIYVSVGNDLKNSANKAGNGRLLCLDATRSGDVTATGKLWSFEQIRSTSTTVAIADGILYTADASGMVYCLDADTGKLYWQDQTEFVWSSMLVADGKVYVAARDRLLAYATGKEKRILNQSKVHESMVSSPAVANGVLYVATGKFLYALQQGKSGVLDKRLSPWTPPGSDRLKEALVKKPKPVWIRLLQISALSACVAVIVWAMVRLMKLWHSKRIGQG